MPRVINHLYKFGSFEMDPDQRLLLCNGKTVPVTPKAFELLVVLVERSGKLVEKTELLGMVWPDVAVEEGNLTVMISQLRKALGDDRGKHEYIETVSKHGYRFVAPVIELPEPEKAPGDALTPGSEPGRDTGPAISSLSQPTQYIRRPRRVGLPRSVTTGLVVAAVAMCLVFFLGRALMLGTFQRSGAVDAASIQSLAVLPFQEMGAADARNTDEYLGEGAADALITKLGNIRRIVVRPTSAIEKYRNTRLSPVEVGKEQGVDAVLDGRIQRQGDRVRLTVQMVRVRDGAELWADSFDEKSTNIFALEDEVSERVLQSLQLRLTNADVRRITRKPTEVPLAYDSYVKGRYFWNKRTADGLKRGLEYFREAIRLDPNFADAYEGVADSYAALGLYAVMPPNEAFPAAREAAEKALRMDERLADAHATLGLIHFYYDWDGPAAENEFRRAIEINPSYAMAHSWSGETLAAMGRYEEATDEARRALIDDPLSMIVNSNAGWTLCLGGQAETAIQTLKKAIEMDPAFPRTHFRLGIVYESRGMDEQAIAEFQKAVELSDGNPYYQASLANAYGFAGHESQARQLLLALRQRSTREYVPAYAVALAYAGLNDKENAFKWLGKAPVDHSTSMAFAKVDPGLAPLRADPRFSVLMQRLNL